MININSYQSREATLQHKQQLKELQNQHEAEIEKIKLNHQKFKNQLKVRNTLEANTLHSEHDIALAKKTMKDQETLDRMQSSLEDVKTRTESEKEQIRINFQKEKENLKANQDAVLKNQKLNHQYILQDIDHEANIELARMQRRINTNKDDTKVQSQEETSSLRQSHLSKITTDRSIYKNQQLAQDDKFQQSLLRQRVNQHQQLTNEKIKNDTMFNNAQKAYQDQFGKLRNDHMSKKKILNKEHENNYKKVFQENEYVLKNLYRKKEAMVESLRQMLKTEGKKEMIKNEDEFYHFTDLNPTYKINEEQNGYIVSIKIPEHEAKNISISADQRQLKLTMDRRFEYTKKDDDGSNDSVSKVESYTSKIPVENLVNGKKIEKSYEDGILRFKIAFA